MPDDSMPISGETSHPGQYMSWVVSIDQFDITSPTTIMAAPSWELGNAVSGRVINLPYFSGAGFGPANRPAYIDGVAVSASWGVQSDWTALVGKMSTITYDIATSFYTTGDDDPRYIRLHPLNHQAVNVTAVVDYDITYHGAIFSATPPNVTSLPVHTSSPSI